MTDVEVLISVVRTWAGELFPDDPCVGKRAAELALSAYIGGASLSEACEEVRTFLTCRARHPSGRHGSSPVC